MPEPIAPTVASLAAAASTIALALFGVDYYSLLYALVGAFFALGHAEQMGRMRAVVYVTLSTLAGAVIGTAVNEYLGLKSRILLIGLCLVGGIVAQALAGALVRAAPGLARKAIKGAADRWTRGGQA